ncbi:MAG: M23 family metallopeptidase [Anaerolineaceae bacterium]|nr:MAG: M23 family metallopeptidase [Anaerolineaceae bacterium]
MMLSDYDMLDKTVPDVKIFLRGIGRVSSTRAFRELYRYYKGIFSDIKYFPVPYMNKDAHKVSYVDSWYAPRSYGGDRSHEGTDLMASNNTRGYFPILSITDGIVENMGWLERGGYRIGIRSDSGGYFYYAHLDTYAPELTPGDSVIAGQLIGFMGDSGYGSEGTIGQFDVHLHLGIYVHSDDAEISVNPYWILKILEYNRTELVH